MQLQRCVFEQHVRLPPLQGECAIDLVTEEAVLEEVSLELPIKLDTRTVIKIFFNIISSTKPLMFNSYISASNFNKDRHRIQFECMQ